MRGGARLPVAPAVGPSGRPAGKQQEEEPQTEDVAAPSLPRGNHLVARMKTSPGFGRFSSPSRVTPVAMSRSQLPVTVAGPRRGCTRLPLPPLPKLILTPSLRRRAPAPSPPPPAGPARGGDRTDIQPQT